MDIDSDESERWEDFFGSSTDLTPSLLGYINSLSNNNVYNEKHNDIKNYFLSSEQSKETEETHEINPKTSDDLNILSPNVQRMLVNNKSPATVTKIVHPRTHKNSNISKITSKTTLKHKTVTQIPLSKFASKLISEKASGNELIDCIASSNESLNKQTDFEQKTLTNQNKLNDDNNFNYNGEQNPADLDENEEDSVVLRRINYFKEICDSNNAFVANCDDGNVINGDRTTIIEAKRVDNEVMSKKRNAIIIPAISSESSTNQSSISLPSLANSSSLSSSKASLSTNHEVQSLKIRPLSASSICSSSSSNSSTSSSDPHPKLGTSYLASSESLADHSECEIYSNNNNSALTMCEKAVLEITDTERSFVEDIGQVIQGYLQDWREKSCLKLGDLETLFSNIEEIYEFNSRLLTKLIDSGTDPTTISQCFIDMHEEFNVYTVYCTSYPEAISLLTTLLQEKHTNTLLISTQKMLNHNLPLGSYLLKPVQRILKYHLLLDNLRKHSDCERVVRAHQLMKTVAHNIDQVKRKLDQQSRVKKLSGILDGWLGPSLSVLGELKQEDVLMEHNKPRVVFLFSTMLIITKPKEDKRLQFKCYIPCKNLMLVEHLPGEPTSFHVLPFDDPKSLIKLTARNRDKKREWAQIIKQAMLEHLDIPSRAKELVFKLGDEDDRPPDKQTWKWHHSSSTPEYLERRSQFRRSELRNRTKKARKNLNSSLSLDGFSQKDIKLPTFQSYSSLNVDQNEMNVPKDANDTDSVRSRSESRVPSDGDDTNGNKSQRNSADNKTSTLVRRKSNSSIVDVKIYNQKNVPKRIEKLRKSRSKTLKETFTFYTDLSENIDNANENTVLKITESTDNLNLTSKEEDKLDLEVIESPDQKPNRKDSEIISEMILENKEFTKILNKPPKKKSFSSDVNRFVQSSQVPPPVPDSTKNADTNLELDLQSIEDICRKSICQLDEIQSDLAYPEPIYESLLRNVHVPYKFAPALTRSVSQQYSKSPIEYCKKAKPRPESDYVTLAYSEDGLVKVEDNTYTKDVYVPHFRNSDSNINYNGKLVHDFEDKNQDTKSEIVMINGQSGKFDSASNFERHGSLSIKSPKNLFQRLISSRTSSPILNRRISDIAETAIYKQGSLDLGSRIAHMDYADPRTLFNSRSSNILINTNAVKEQQTELVQRDSVFSSTDSVCDPKSPILNDEEDYNDSYYEKNVEECLENDFRDSAVYSGDDNDRKLDAEDELYECITEISPVMPVQMIIKTPPPIPVKPAHLEAKKVIIPPKIVTKSEKSRSWVLQQVQKFE